MSTESSHANELVGGFRRLEVIGVGAQGKVWKAECVEDVHGIVPVGTVVALKEKLGHGDGLDAQWQKLESRIGELKAIDHPNVVRYLGCFRENALDHEKHVVVQELLEGETLKERLDALNRWNPMKNRLGLDVDEGIDIVSQVASGLGYTASLGIYHRDVKPGNIFLCRDGKVKLIDFGVARQSDGTITEEGNIRGSWNYLAPDFADGVFRGDQQSDIFSVGVVLHEIITGRLPYQDSCGDDMAAYFARWSKMVEDTPIRIVSNTRRLLLGIDSVFDKTLTPDRSERYRDFAQLQDALGRVNFVEQRHGDKTFRRLQFIGEGGFGEVFKARWLECNQPVAVKMLKGADAAGRFHAEAEVMKTLDDPCFTRFVDFFEEDGRSFLVMSFLPGMPGSSLRDAINRSKIEARLRDDVQMSGGLPKDVVLAAFERYARGLGMMHRHSPMIIHRDIKPSNLYCPSGHPERVAIMDFGIVKTGDSSTASGITPCTFDYAPPEIVTVKDRGGPGMDIFALGLCMYEALTGKMGYPRITNGQSGMIQFFERCRLRKAPVFDDPRVVDDPELLRLLRRMTDPDVSTRMTSADQVAVEIRKLFYRDIESDTADTRFFDSNTDKTAAIDDEGLRAWFEAWKKANPVDEKRLMEIYREQWLKEHEEGESQVRKLPRPARWKTPLLMLASVMMTAAAVIFAWPHIDRVIHPEQPVQPVPPDNSRLIEAQLKLARKDFETDFEKSLDLAPVDTRRRRLDEAESKLKKAIGTRIDLSAGLLYEETSADVVRFNERLAKLRRSAIGIVDNRCDSKIEVGGRIVYAGNVQLFEFEDGKPASRKITMFGYEPKAVPADFDGKTLVLKNDDFVPSNVKVELPEDMDASVVCLFDGTSTTNALSLKPRAESYRCVFRKQGYDDKAQTFAVEIGKNMRLGKLGAWTPSPVEVTLGQLEAGVVCTIDGKPVAGKAMLKPGDHAVKYARRGYEDIASTFKVEIGVGRKVPSPAEIGQWKMASVRVSVPYLDPGVKCLIDGSEESRRYRDMLPGGHVCQYERAGYVTQSNIAFVVALATPTNLPAPSKWVVEKVRVTIPNIPNVAAKFDGSRVSGTLLLMPTNVPYWLEYTEGGTGRYQRVPFIVQVNTPMDATRPTDSGWTDPRPASATATNNSQQVAENIQMEALREAQLKLARNEFEDAFGRLLRVEPVDTRRRRLDEAESKLKKAIGTRIDLSAGLLYEETSADVVRFNERLAKLRQSAIGIVDNRCDSKIEIAGRTVYASNEQLFEFEDGKPASRKITMFGYEPKAVPADFDGKTLVLKNDDFVPSNVKVELPEDMDASVVCLFDGTSTTNALSLKPRAESYRCVFRKQGYDDKAQAFAVEIGKNMRLGKLGAWTPSPVEVTLGQLEAGVVCTIDGKPIAGKAMLKPGDHAVKYARRGYEDIASSFKVEIGVGRKAPAPSEIGQWKMAPVRVTVPYLGPGVKCLIDGSEELRRYRDMLPGGHVCQYERAGYVTQSNIAFVVALATPTNLPAPSKWVVEKVRVTIPELANIEVKLDGKRVSGTLLLMPTNVPYRLEYSEMGTGRYQRVPFIVQINTPMVAPRPTDSDWTDPRPAPVPVPKPKPKPSGPVSAQAQKEYGEAVDYYEFQEYGEAFEHYYKAFKAGYPLSEQDTLRVKRSFDEVLAVLNGHIEDWKRRPLHKDSHRNIEDLTKQRGDLIKRHREISGK